MLRRYVVSNIFSKKTLNVKESNELIRTAQKVDRELNYSTDGYSVFAVNLNTVKEKINDWNKFMNPIIPYYAMKSNPMNEICDLFDHFDCASEAEIKQILSLGKKSENILFANTAKCNAHINYSKNNNVNIYTADGLPECEKILSINKNAKIILRLTAFDEGASVKFSGKYGINEYNEWCHIIDNLMRHQNNPFIGVSFHNGSCSTKRESNVFAKALERTDNYLDYVRLKYPSQYNYVKIMNIGGGFNEQSNLEEIRKGLDPYIKKYSNYKWVAECGRYFSENSGSLFVPIISQKKRNDGQFHVLSDSIYHSFSCLMYDSVKSVERENNWFGDTADNRPNTYGGGHRDNDYINNDGLEHCNIVGQTCDGIDFIHKGNAPKNLKTSDVLIFPSFGAYSVASSGYFNGFEPAYKHILK